MPRLSTSGSLVISIPPREVVDLPIPGSVFDVTLLNGMNLSAELRLALTVADAANEQLHGGGPIRCVVRPEIFTHDESLDWLMRRLEGATDHIALSDGSSMKFVPALRNHLFTYGLQSNLRQWDFRKLLRRAPELLGQYSSQINSFHRVSSGGLASEPEPVSFRLGAPLEATPLWFYGFYLNPHSLEDSAERMLQWGDLEGPRFDDFAKITYIPLTDAAAHNASFQRLVGELIAATYFDPHACLLIRLPQEAAELTARMRFALEGIRSGARQLPQARAANVFFLAGDLPEAMLQAAGLRLSWLVHQSFEHWRYTQEAYRKAEDLAVFLDQEWTAPSEAAKTLLRETFGQDPRFCLTPRMLDADGFPE